MSQFFTDLGHYVTRFTSFISEFSNSLWVYPIVFFAILNIVFFLVLDNK